MDDTEVQKQINQMVEFIKQEAEEKAGNRVAAEESSTSKSYKWSKWRSKDQRYERKESGVGEKENRTIDDRKRGSNQSFNRRDRMMEEVLNTAREKLGSVSKSPQYKQLLAGLIAQGAKNCRSNCTIRCRKQDENVCKEAIALARNECMDYNPLDARVYRRRRKYRRTGRAASEGFW